MALVATVRPELFERGPPSWSIFLSLYGTATIAALGLIGVVFLNRSTLRGLWDSDLGSRDKILVPVAAGLLLGLASVFVRQFVSIDAVLEEFARAQGVGVIDPPLAGAVLGYLSGGVLIDIVYFLILVPPVVYVFSDRMLRGAKQGVVFWVIATPLVLWEPLTNPPLSFSVEAFGPIGAIGIVALGTSGTFVQAWFLRARGFVALVSVRAGIYAVTHILYPQLS